ncbi:gamma-aminobutyric acid receptor subunit beta-like isoform X2 [Nematostella vectensis]|uniref:gamma-aminobutyric acid receptor subunit beta-like isoform X2 n=1 Tax=Nematostella vectensis TaxID=45351 RepID=UPI002076F45C|nr:gamma-aminobutyric acid receptor subunit beta-like isoform X2 [Nematostella vectensis]
MRNLLYLVPLAILLQGSQTNLASGNRYKQATEAMNNLLRNYDKRIRPYSNTDKLNITVQLAVERFGDIREKEMDFSLDVYLNQTWHDDRLNHTLDHPIILSGEFKGSVWQPDTIILYVRSLTVYNSLSEPSSITIYSDGTVRSTVRLALVINCLMDLRDYPLDEQECSLAMLSYTHQYEDIVYKWSQKPISIYDHFMDEFSIESYKASREIARYTSGNWSRVTTTFLFKRQIEYALLQIYAPTMLIVSLSWLSFWISKEAVPARVTLGVTTILTIVTLIGSFRFQFPKVSYIKAIDWFFIVSFVFVFGAQIEFIAVLLHSVYKQQVSMAVPDVENGVAESPRDFSEVDTQTESTNQQNDNKERSNSVAQSSLRQRKPNTSLRKTKSALKFAFVENDCDVIDKISRVLFPVGYGLFHVTYWFYFEYVKFLRPLSSHGTTSSV